MIDVQLGQSVNLQPASNELIVLASASASRNLSCLSVTDTSGCQSQTQMSRTQLQGGTLTLMTYSASHSHAAQAASEHIVSTVGSRFRCWTHTYAKLQLGALLCHESNPTAHAAQRSEYFALSLYLLKSNIDVPASSVAKSVGSGLNKVFWCAGSSGSAT